MKHRKIILLAVLIYCCIFYAAAQTAPKPAPAVKAQPIATKTALSIIDAFFKKYKAGGADTAINYLFSTNKLFTNAAQIALLKTKLDSLQVSLGKYTGKELISQKSASLSLVYYSYLVKFENQPVRFTFMFYKPQNEWKLYRFKYDDQLDSELEEAGRINNKHPQ